MNQRMKFISTKTVMLLERGKPGACAKHAFQKFVDICVDKDWEFRNIDENTQLYACTKCNLERMYKSITII